MKTYEKPLIMEINLHLDDVILMSSITRLDDINDYDTSVDIVLP